jgi:hypothetical protein
LQFQNFDFLFLAHISLGLGDAASLRATKMFLSWDSMGAKSKKKETEIAKSCF